MTTAFSSAYMQTETLNFTFGRQAVIVYLYVYSRRYVVMTSNNLVPLQLAARRELCKFLANSSMYFELDCICGKPMKRRFQRYIVCMEILSTFHARVEYISVREKATPFKPMRAKNPRYRPSHSDTWTP